MLWQFWTYGTTQNYIFAAPSTLSANISKKINITTISPFHQKHVISINSHRACRQHKAEILLFVGMSESTSWVYSRYQASKYSVSTLYIIKNPTHKNHSKIQQTGIVCIPPLHNPMAGLSPYLIFASREISFWGYFLFSIKCDTCMVCTGWQLHLIYTVFKVII